MSSLIQNKINPKGDFVTRDINLLNKDKSEVNENKVDFQKLLGESNKIKQEEVKKTKGGDLSSFKDYNSFLENLNQKTNQPRTPKNNLEKDDFLKLFVTQLQQQDPLKPKDGAEMASQLAQFNNVEQMMNMNKTLEQIKELNQKSDQQIVSSYLGKDISVTSNKMNFSGGKHNEIFALTDKPYSSATLEIKDKNGQTIHKQELGNLNQGENQIKWDGRTDEKNTIADGEYTLELKGKLDGGGEHTIPLESRLTVTGATLGQTTALDTKLGKIPIGDVKHIRLPQAQAPLSQEIAKNYPTEQEENKEPLTLPYFP